MPDRATSPRPALRAAARVLVGAGTATAVASLALALQRVALPFAALAFAAGDVAVAGVALGVSVVLGFGRSIAAERVAVRVRANVLDAFLGAAESLPPHLTEAADVVSPRFAVCMPELVHWAQEGVVASIAGVLATPFVLGILLREFGVALVAPVAIAAGAVAGGAALASRRVADLWQRAWERAVTVQTRFYELHSGLVELRAQAELDAFGARLRAHLAQFSSEDARARRAAAVVSTSVSIAALAAACTAALALGADAPALSRAALVGLAALPSLLSLAAGLGKLTAARSELEIVGQLAPPPPRSAPGGPLDARAALELEEIAFTYPAAAGRPPRPVFTGFSWSLAPGASVAIVGPNGSGKTTLLHLVLGVLRPDAGRSRLGGEARDLDDPRWHARIAYVSQRPLEMRDASIADNVRVFAPDASDDDVARALRDVGVWAPLRARVASDAAVLSLTLAALSRGEARRVTLARAFARDADVVVLDEPEANLDASARAAVVEALGRLARRCRVIAAVHDPGMTAFAEAILELRAPEPAAPDAPA